MADAEELRRLVLHAADRIAEEDPGPAYEHCVRSTSSGDTRAALMHDLRTLIAAMTLAENTLRMVAACMAVKEPEPAGGAR